MKWTLSDMIEKDRLFAYNPNDVFFIQEEPVIRKICDIKTKKQGLIYNQRFVSLINTNFEREFLSQFLGKNRVEKK